MRGKWFAAALIALSVVFLATWIQAAENPPAEKPKAEKPKAEKAAPKPPVTAKPEELEKVTAAMPDQPYAKPAKARKLFVFSLTKGFPHSSVDIGARAFEIMGKKTGAWETVISKDVGMFAADKLKDFDAVMMNNTTGKDLLDDPELRKSLLEFVKGGKGIGGCHSATDAFYEKWPEYGEMMGGYFAGHPFRKISVKLDDPASALMAMFDGKGFEISDEIYTFKAPYSRENLHILMSIDWENAHLKGGTRPSDNDYALSWIREYGQGRVFYCGFGHDHQIFWNTPILKHYLAGIQYLMGDIKADATPTAKLNPAPKPAPGPDLEQKKAAVEPQSVTVYAADAAPAAKPDAEGWICLFDGKDTSAWQAPAADKWKVVEGILTWEKGCGNIWTKEKFGDFVLDLEFKVTKGTNSGIFLRSPEGEKNWLNGSFEIQIMDPPGNGQPGKHNTGALYDCLAPSTFAEKPAGEWNHMVITFKGNSLKIVLNDKPIMDADLNQWTEAGKNPDGSKNKFKTAYKDMAKVGNLGLQDHGAPVWYRNVKVKPLAGATAAADAKPATTGRG